LLGSSGSCMPWFHRQTGFRRRSLRERDWCSHHQQDQEQDDSTGGAKDATWDVLCLPSSIGSIFLPFMKQHVCLWEQMIRQSLTRFSSLVQHVLSDTIRSWGHDHFFSTSCKTLRHHIHRELAIFGEEYFKWPCLEQVEGERQSVRRAWRCQFSASWNMMTADLRGSWIERKSRLERHQEFMETKVMASVRYF
jgi:hypothetical protein